MLCCGNVTVPVSGVWQVDELQAKEAAQLHHAHVLIFGEVRHGLGMHTLHLPPGHPERQAVISKFEALKVGAAQYRSSQCRHTVPLYLYFSCT